MQKALITGITGQDGSYLAEYLLSKGYEVHGIIRRASSFNTHRIDHLYVDPHNKDVRLFLHYGDISDSSRLANILYNINPGEIYHLAAQSHVRVAFDIPEYTADITGIGTVRLLEAIKTPGVKSKIYNAATSELFGSTPPPQNEASPFYPRSPYAAAKLYSYWITVNYREAYNLFACNGILFNHESPRRGETFVTRKITMALANILTCNQKKIYLGNLNAKRDWGFAPEYTEMMHLMLSQGRPSDYAVGTGESHTVRDFVNAAFNYAGIELEWQGKGIEERGIIKSFDKKYDTALKTGETVIEVDPRYFRPTEVEFLQADISKAIKELNWSPKVTFTELVKIMVDYDMKLKNLTPKGEGMKVSRLKGFNYTNHDYSFHEKLREGC